jgi:hypothetical protein
MTGLEHRGRSERARSRRLAPAVIAAAAVLCGPGLAGCGQQAGHAPGGGTRSGGPASAADPPLVAIAVSSTHGSPARVELISPSTGRVAKVVAQVSTGNGFAFSPDLKSLYVVGPVRGTVEIRRISVATGKASFVADGAYPAVSPSGRYLAYATGRQFSSVAVRDLRTGRTRVTDLRPLLGSGGNLLNEGGITWLGNGNELVVVPGIAASFAAAGTAAGAAAGTAAGAAAGTAAGAAAGSAAGAIGGTAGRALAPPGRQAYIVVKLGPDGLAARQIVVPDPYQEPFQVVSGDLSQPRAFLVARIGFGAAGTITRVSLRGTGYRTQVVARLPASVMPVVMAPHGDRVLYLVGHAPPVLWTAAISNGRLTGQHRLFADTSKFGVDLAAW